VRVVHVSTFTEGGAARAALRLHRALPSTGCESVFFTSAATVPDAVAMPMPRSFLAQARRGLRRRWLDRVVGRAQRRTGTARAFFSHDRTPFEGEPLARLPDGDIVNLHWVAGFIDLSLLHRVRRPLVWTLHDTNPLTGGCHHDLGCTRFTTGCGLCPALGSAQEHDLSARIWQRKRAALARVAANRLHIVTPSRWLAQQAQQSPLLAGFPTSVIANGLDVDVFAPLDRALARQLLGLPQDRRVVLFIAHELADEQKGLSFLVRALEHVPGQIAPCVALAGRLPAGLELPADFQPLGSLGDERLVALAYAASDLTVIPSLAENFPNAALESLACTTPVVAFAVGGSQEIVRHGETGLLVPPRDSAALAAAIMELLGDAERRRAMGRLGREIVAREWSSAVQARRYVGLYRTLLADATR
jgi:glycosyltransferase involved in cell wall biosynthesis